MGEQLLGREMLRLAEGGVEDGETLVGDAKTVRGEMGAELLAGAFDGFRSHGSKSHFCLNYVNHAYVWNGR